MTGISLLFLCVFLTILPIEHAKYPMTTRQCFATLAKPDKKLICPEQRNNYCIKEISDLKKDLCGKTQYFGDFWDAKLGVCYFKYCSDECNAGDSSFTFGGTTYTRSQFCCKNKDYCNAAPGVVRGSYFIVVFCISIAVLLMAVI